jgi:hypothetical protein
VDNSSVSWAPRPALVVTGWLAALLALVGAFTYDDRLGAVLFGVATILLVLLSAHGMLVRPRLAADAGGVHIRTARGQVDLGWPETHATLRTTQRLGRDSPTLEIAAGDRLFVFGRLELGTDPRDVLDALTTLQP